MTIFARILKGEIPCSKVYEDEHVLAFDDITPQAPVHVLIIPKITIVNLTQAEPQHEQVLGRLLLAARKVAEIKGVMSSGFRVVMNNGEDAGQSVFHMHLHVLAGRGLSWPPG
jgi:histidine triad (HIT) family protein